MGKYDNLTVQETQQQLERLHQMEKEHLDELSRIDAARKELKLHLQGLGKK